MYISRGKTCCYSKVNRIVPSVIHNKKTIKKKNENIYSSKCTNNYIVPIFNVMNGEFLCFSNKAINN